MFILVRVAANRAQKCRNGGQLQARWLRVCASVRFSRTSLLEERRPEQDVAPADRWGKGRAARPSQTAARYVYLWVQMKNQGATEGSCRREKSYRFNWSEKQGPSSLTMWSLTQVGQGPTGPRLLKATGLCPFAAPQLNHTPDRARKTSQIIWTINVNLKYQMINNNLF